MSLSPVDAPVAEPIDVTNLVQTIIVILSGLSVIYFGLRKWVRQQVGDPVQKVYQQIQTENGRTLGQTAHDLKTDVDALGLQAQRNFQLIEQLNKRLDEHQMYGSHHRHD